MKDPERGGGGLAGLAGAEDEGAAGSVGHDVGLVGVGFETEVLLGPSEDVGLVGG